MRSREAWLAAIATALGMADVACKKDVADGPAAVREVASASSSAPVVAASAPSETASAVTIASAVPSASASTASTSSAKPPDLRSVGLGNLGTIGIGHGVCGARVNPACGASPAPRDVQPNVNIQLLGSDNADDRRVVQTNLRARVRSCALNAVKNDPNTQGDVVMNIEIDAHGAVTNVDSQGALAAGATTCMKSAARNVKFAEGTARTIRVHVHVDRSY
jgi:hypothetical protein